jgi:uncharacterized paraquat-inducible protein A
MNENNKISKKEDEIFCPECGNIIKKNAAVCPNCGVQIKEIRISKEETNTTAALSAPIKSKAVSVVLAIFFGFWSWIYTYRRNGLKFWITFIGAPAVIITIAHFLKESGTLFILFAYIGIWIWAIIDNAVKPNSFYDNYPNE